eukprot:1146238-Pelagomonas_calceolata.AAC.1
MARVLLLRSCSAGELLCHFKCACVCACLHASLYMHTCASHDLGRVFCQSISMKRNPRTRNVAILQLCTRANLLPRPKNGFPEAKTSTKVTDSDVHCFLIYFFVRPQNTVLKTWQGKPENVGKAQEALLKRAKANSDAQRGQYNPATEGSSEAAQSMYQKGYQY